VTATPTPFDSVLIANRGEIVTRIARTARQLGLRTIAIASDADRDAPHTRACDSVVAIGGERAADSYLRIEAILAAARASGAQAVHPGYGFLSENAAFARAVLDAGLVWIGPPPDAMRAMADKSRARRRLGAAAVPVLPGYDGDDQSPATLRAEALRIGMPLMIKAAAGGGGRGMRLVRDVAHLADALASAAAEARAAFGDARLLIERALLAPRHVEIQVLADAHGRVLHLGERDCSVQRRHQKIVEEAPSPAVSPTLRRRMGDVAVAIAREVGYVGAGTVEFLLDGESFWFMEMNTRLQVEHPVTEALIGIDLVEWQLRVAAGEPLPFAQNEMLERFEHGGHAIEVRLCAEDPGDDYLPQSGTIVHWHPPQGVRVDHALASGCAVSPFYDSMIAKLIAHASSRDAAIRTLADALDRTACLGVTTNRALLARVLRDPAFGDGNAVTTAFLAEHYADNAARADAPPSWLRALAAASAATLPDAPLPALWAGWTSSNHVATMVPLGAGRDDREERWHLSGSPASLTATHGDATHCIEALQRTSRSSVTATIDGRPVVARGIAGWWLADGHEAKLQDLRLVSTAEAANTDTAGGLRAPMHGRITQVLVDVGQAVEAGALLVVMEAMKMEHRLHAPRSGVVQALHAKVGDQVAARQALAEVA
jgi:geranyl-CoA carboxylase alpha subunit